MTSKGKRRMIWTVVIIAAVLLAAAAALQFAIGRNGPAVLDTVDRITAGDRGVELAEKVSLGSNPAQKVAVYRDFSQTTGEKPVLIFVHGGSWRSGNPDDYGFFARGLAPEGFVVVLAGYRLGDAGVFPGMVEDTARAVAWTKANISRHGGDPDAIFIAGHSAGAYNVAMVGLDRQWLDREGLEPDIVKGVIGLAGPYDFYPFDSDSTRAAFGDASDPEATQPINFVRGDAPPMLLLTGKDDTVVKPRNTRALSAALKGLNGQVETHFIDEMDHNLIIMATASPWRGNHSIIERMAGFMNRITAAEAAEMRAARGTSVPVQAGAP